MSKRQHTLLHTRTLNLSPFRHPAIIKMRVSWRHANLFFKSTICSVSLMKTPALQFDVIMLWAITLHAVMCCHPLISLPDILCRPEGTRACRWELRYVMSPKHMIMDYGLLWINALVGVCMPVQLCVHAHVQHACLRAWWLSRVHADACEREDEQEGVCSQIMLPSRPSSAPRCLPSLNLCISQQRDIRPQPQESSQQSQQIASPHQSKYHRVFWLHGETRTHHVWISVKRRRSRTCVHAAR